MEACCLMVSALDSGSKGPSSSPGWEMCSWLRHSASLHQSVGTGIANLILGQPRDALTFHPGGVEMLRGLNV